MEITHKKFGTSRYKSLIINQWKYKGVIHDDLNALFQQYINTTQCQHCAKIFKSTRDRHLDHDHTTGKFRMIVCHKCNVKDSYIKYPDGYDEKQYTKQYRENNKEKLEAWSGENIECDCGFVGRRNNIARHKKSAKHISWRTNMLRKYICHWKLQR